MTHSRRAAKRLRELPASTQSKHDALDKAFGSGELRVWLTRHDHAAGDGGRVLAEEIPVVNKVAAGYPSEFTDLGYPARVADDYVRVPDLDDADAFGRGWWGFDGAEYREGDVVVFSQGPGQLGRGLLRASGARSRVDVQACTSSRTPMGGADSAPAAEQHLSAGGRAPRACGWSLFGRVRGAIAEGSIKGLGWGVPCRGSV